MQTLMSVRRALVCVSNSAVIWLAALFVAVWMDTDSISLTNPPVMVNFMIMHGYIILFSFCSTKTSMSVWKRLTIVIKKMLFVLTQWGITLVLVTLDTLEVVSAALVRHNFDACRHGYLHL